MPEVLFIDDNEIATKMPTADALKIAQEAGLDLIEVSPKAQPPVVKLGDFGSYLYQLKKR